MMELKYSFHSFYETVITVFIMFVNLVLFDVI